MAEAELGIKVRVEPATTSKELQDKINKIAEHINIYVPIKLNTLGDNDLQKQIDKKYSSGLSVKVSPQFEPNALDNLKNLLEAKLSTVNITVDSVAVKNVDTSGAKVTGTAAGAASGGSTGGGAKQSSKQKRSQVEIKRNELDRVLIDAVEALDRKINDELLSVAGNLTDTATAKLAVALEQKTAAFRENMAAIAELFTGNIHSADGEVTAFGKAFLEEDLYDAKTLQKIIDLIHDQMAEITAQNTAFNAALKETLQHETAIRKEKEKAALQAEEQAKSRQKETEALAKQTKLFIDDMQKYLEHINKITNVDMLSAPSGLGENLNRSVEAFQYTIEQIMSVYKGENMTVSPYGWEISQSTLASAESLAKVKEVILQRYLAIVEEVKNYNNAATEQAKLDKAAEKATKEKQTALEKLARQSKEFMSTLLTQADKIATESFDLNLGEALDKKGQSLQRTIQSFLDIADVLRLIYSGEDMSVNMFGLELNREVLGDAESLANLQEMIRQRYEAIVREVKEYAAASKENLRVQQTLAALTSQQATLRRSMSNIAKRDGGKSDEYRNTEKVIEAIDALKGAIARSSYGLMDENNADVVKWAEGYDFAKEKVTSFAGAIALMREMASKAT